MTTCQKCEGYVDGSDVCYFVDEDEHEYELCQDCFESMTNDYRKNKELITIFHNRNDTIEVRYDPEYKEYTIIITTGSTVRTVYFCY